MLRHPILLIFALGLPMPTYAQTLYKSVTADGRVVYSDHPPAQAKVVKTLAVDAGPATALPASMVERLRKLEAGRPAAPPARDTVLYSAAWCGYCDQAKAYLAAKGIPYQEIDIDTPDGLASFARAGRGTGVPLLLAGGRSIRGFSAASYDEIFASRRRDRR